jgi:hypothetical protein
MISQPPADVRRTRNALVPGRTDRQHALSHTQLAAIRAAMQVFVEEDLEQGMTGAQRVFCDACELPRPRPGAIRYQPYLLCNRCATAYEVARAARWVRTAGQFVHGKTSGVAGTLRAAPLPA